jgi:hypothetical protein
MSKIKVNSIEAATGSTITIPSGQTLDISSTTLTLPSTVVTTTGTQTLTNKTIGVSQLSGTLPVANGGTGLTTLGSASQVLRVNSGATALEFAAVSSDFVLLATTDASSSASVSFDGYFSSTYKNYQVIISNLVSATDTVSFRTRLRKSNADITTSHYSILGIYSDGYNTPVTSGSTGTDQGNRVYQDVQTLQDTANVIRGFGLSNNTEWSANMNVYIFDPLSTNNNKAVMTDYFIRGNNTYNVLQTGKNSFFLSDNQNALSGITFYLSSGNITRGNFKLYGIK